MPNHNHEADYLTPIGYCSSCGALFASLADITECQQHNRAAFDIGRGTLIETISGGIYGSGMLLIVATATAGPHGLMLTCWVAADSPAGLVESSMVVDSVDNLIPMDNFSSPIEVVYGMTNPLPTTSVQRGSWRLTRAIEFLHGQGIKPHLWDGRRSIAL